MLIDKKPVGRITESTILEGFTNSISPEEPVSKKDTLNAFNHFYEKCISTLENNDVLVPVIKDELDKARDQFIKSLTK